MNSIEKRTFIVFIVIYLVGLAGFLIPELQQLVLPLTPLTLLLTFIVPLWLDKSPGTKAILALTGIAVAGFFCEVAGVETGKIFGSYQYGKTLGLSLLKVPLIIGLNWAALVYFSTHIFSGKIKNKWAASLVSAAIMTAYDFIMEPVAVKYDFWHWKNNIIPLQNYIAWFALSAIFSFVFLSLHKPKSNKLAVSVFLLQALFFSVLHLYQRFF